MESFGEILRTTRESKNLSLEKISREVSIELRYLQGLEDEDSTVFPGEAYMTGFLRNYGNYLDLDSEYLLKLYKNKKIQESPVPEGLIAKQKPKWIIPSVLIPVILIAGVVALILILLNVRSKKVEDLDAVLLANNSKNKMYELTNEKFSQRVYKGDQFIVHTAEDRKIIITVADTLGSFGIEAPSGRYYTDLSEETDIDIDGDSAADLIIYVSDISNTDESRGAEVSLLLHKDSYVPVVINDEDIPMASEIKSKHPQKVILEDNRAYPFTINATFRDPCLFRYRVDNQDSVETYFTRGEVLTATPHNGIRLWASDGNTVSFSIVADSKFLPALDVGPVGRVLVEDIKWIKDSDGRYKLVVIELD